MYRKAKATVTLTSLFFVGASLTAVGFWWATDWTGLSYVVDYSCSVLGCSEGLKSQRSQVSSAAVQDLIERDQNIAEVSGVPTGFFNYGGSSTWTSIREYVDPTIQANHPQFRLRHVHSPISGPESVTGLSMLLNNELSFAQSSRPLTAAEYERAQMQGVSLKEIPIAIDGIAIAVHPDLGVPGLTISQLKKIYTGVIDNWQQIGGPDILITPYSQSREVGGTVAFFMETVLENEEFGPNVEYISNTTDGLQKVAANQGGIYYATAIEVVPQCSVKTVAVGQTANTMITPYKTPAVDPARCPGRRDHLNRTAIQTGEYPLTRQLSIIVKQDGQENEQAGLAYAALLLSEQGQDLISRAGFSGLYE